MTALEKLVDPIASTLRDLLKSLVTLNAIGGSFNVAAMK